jgi:holin-like protein
MKYIKQFAVILTVSFIGEILRELIPLPIPAGIYGILLLFACLKGHIISVSSVKETAVFLIEIMPLMFLPAAVGLIDAWPVLRPSLTAYICITVVSTFAVMAAAGQITERLLKNGKESGR